MFFFDHAWALLIFLLNLLFFAAVIVVGLYAINRFMRGTPNDNALKILSERFARGEIDQQEYEQRKAILRKSP